MHVFLKIDWQQILAAVAAFFASGAGFSIVVFVVGALLSRLWKWKPTWRQYRGSIISAIKYAEKAIPDDIENKTMKRTDAALKYVLRVFEEVEGREPKPSEVREIDEGIRIEHARLEAAGNIPNGSKPKPAGSEESEDEKDEAG